MWGLVVTVAGRRESRQCVSAESVLETATAIVGALRGDGWQEGHNWTLRRGAQVATVRAIWPGEGG
jgi:hypothetical protein